MFYPKVSIVIPVFNGSNFIAEAIESALAQTYKNVEIIVINDGSQDNDATHHAVAKYHDKVRYYYKKNGGVASALNLAIEHMNGDYFSWLSHDDLYAPEKLEKQIALLAQLVDKEVILYSDYGIFQHDANNTTRVHLKGVPASHFRYWLTIENSLHGCTLLIPRHAFSTVGLFNEQLQTTQDYDLWFRMAHTFPFLHLPEPLVKARSHSEQNSHKLKPIVLDECNELLINFIRSLSTDEIKKASGLSLMEAYQQISLSMTCRGFLRAAEVAQEFLYQHREKTFYESLDMKAQHSIYAFKRKYHLGFLYLKQKIKSFLSLPKTSSPNTYLKDKFDEVYEKNLFCGKDSRSGEGSSMIQTQTIRKEIPKLLNELKIKTMMDAPCGDWHWMKEVELPVEHYIGVDIVETLVQKNQSSYGSKKAKFLALDLTTSHLPYADLIFSRDCLVHLSFHDALKVINNFKRTGAKYLLTTTFVQREQNEDLGDGFWRPLNKQRAPFNFPEPLALINEGCTEGNNEYGDKSLGLWLLQEINCTLKD